MAKRSKPSPPALREPTPAELPVAAPAERHSGEGSASVLESLRRLESGRRRLAGEPAEPPPEDTAPRP